MPGSDLKNIPSVQEFFDKHKEIKTIVDLGPGAATYSKLIKGDFVWKAVEIWGPYIKRFELDKYYSEIRIGDIRYMEFPKGDCCIAGDVLEHLRREDFISTFKKIDKQFDYVVISVPVNLLADDVFEGNFLEGHQSYWSIDELDKVFVGYEKVNTDPCMTYFKAPK